MEEKEKKDLSKTTPEIWRILNLIDCICVFSNTSSGASIPFLNTPNLEKKNLYTENKKLLVSTSMFVFGAKGCEYNENITSPLLLSKMTLMNETDKRFKSNIRESEGSCFALA